MLSESQRLNQVSLVNQNAQNRACQRHLRPEYRSPAFPYSLALARQALENQPPDDRDDLEAMLVRLQVWPPQEAQDWLFSQNGESVLLSVDELNQADQKTAENLLLDLLRAQMVEHA